jgi:RHS repeat-associated protein
VFGNVSATQTVSFTKSTPSTETLFWHDPNGNLATQMWQGVTMLYRYDRENRLTKVTSNGVTVLECWYDGQGRRLAKREVAGGQTNVTQYVYDGWTVLAVLNQNGEMIEAYTRGSGIAGDIGTIVAETKFSGGAATNTYYYHNNHRGDVTAVRSTNGTTLATWDYRPFGEERSATGSLNPRYRFSSKEYDASVGLYYYGYRHYSVALCRWLQEDAAPDRTERSTHAFVGNCPISKIDAYGLRASTTSSKSGVDDWYDPIQTINEFCKAYHDMVEANTIGADRYFHCMAHCNAAKKGGGGAALCLGLIREGCDNVRNACTKKNRPLRQCLDSLGDIAANLHGLHVAEHENCRDRCAIYRPPGLAAKY